MPSPSACDCPYRSPRPVSGHFIEMQIWGLVWNDTALSGGGCSSVAPEGPHVLVATGHTCSVEKSVSVARNQICLSPERGHRAGGVAYLIDACLDCTEPWCPSQHGIHQAWGRKASSQHPASGAERSETQGHPWLHRNFKDILGDLRPCQKS